jgi:hypothetical protein
MREHGLGPFGRADLHPRRNPLDRQGRLAPQPGSDGQLAGVAAPASGQLGLLPAPARKLLEDDAVGLLLGGLPVEFSGVALAELPVHPFKHLLPELLAAQTPATAQRLEFFLVSFLEPAGLHVPLEFLPPGRRIILNAVLAQQAVNAHPAGPMFRRRQIPAKAAPRVGQQAVFGPQQVGSHRVKMHVIARRFQITIAAALDYQRFVAAAKNVAEKLLAVIQTDRVGAQEPAHALHEIRVGCFQYQVKMVAHQAIRMHLPSRLLACLRQRFEEVLAVHIIDENVLPAVSTIHHVIDRARKLHSHGARHGASVSG